MPPRRPIASRAVTAQPWRATSSCEQPDMQLAGTATSIIFGFGSLRLFIRSTYSSTDFTWSRGLKRFSSPMVETVSPL